MLGCLVFTLLLKANSIGQEYFVEQLSKPELRHFLIKQNGRRLDFKSTAELKEILRVRSSNPKEETAFTRRQNFLQAVVASDDGSCPKTKPRRTKSNNAALLVFEGPSLYTVTLRTK